MRTGETYDSIRIFAITVILPPAFGKALPHRRYVQAGSADILSAGCQELNLRPLAAGRVEADRMSALPALAGPLPHWGAVEHGPRHHGQTWILFAQLFSI